MIDQWITRPEHLPRRDPRPGKLLAPAALLVLLVVALLSYQIWLRQAGLREITQSELEDQYGIQVQLLGVTAGGGLVDLRLKVLDAEKAQRLIPDLAQAPVLWVGGRGAILRVSSDGQAEGRKIENGSPIFNLYPNRGNAIKPGTRVTLVFGNVRLQPIVAR